MEISAVEYKQFGDHHKIQAIVGGRLLWFRLPGEAKTDSQDASAFVIAALIPAMLVGEDITVPAEYLVSHKLLSAIDKIQTIYNVWNPVFQRINVVARGAASRSDNVGTCVFFSGGVDGTYTLLRHLEEIDELVLINGFDFNMETETWRKMVAKNSEFAENMGKKLLAVETNFKTFTSSFGLARYANFGSVLACVSQLLGHRRALLSGSDTYNLIRSIGCHPLLDYLWSTESTEIVHCGLEADRSLKIATIIQNRPAMENLWVCWKDPGYNCGTCSKCVRTAIALELSGESPDIFREPVTTARMRASTVTSEEEMDYYGYFLAASRRQQQNDITPIIKRKILRFKIKRFVKDILDLALPDSWSAWIQLQRSDENEVCDVSVKPRSTDRKTIENAVNHFATTDTITGESEVGSVYDIVEADEKAR